MADFTKTISNAISLYGGEQTSKWGTMTWGQNWAFGSGELVTATGKLISNSITLDSSISVLKDIAVTISEALSILVDMGSEVLTDSRNWSKVWGSSTNAESRPGTSYQTSGVTTVYSAVADVTTSWTEQ